MKLLVSVVNFNTREITLNCLRSLESEVKAVGDTKVVVVDNGSEDGSVAAIEQLIHEQRWESWAECVSLDENSGFSRGNNAAMRRALEGEDPPEFIMLLNSDTLVFDGALQSLIEVMESDDRVGIAGGRLQYPDGTPDRSAYRFCTPLSEFVSEVRLAFVDRLMKPWVIGHPQQEALFRTDWVPGASMMIRSSTLRETGLFDEKYFMYYEDLDLCLAAHRLGWTCWYVPESRVTHFRGATSKLTDKSISPLRRPSYYFESRRHFFRKNYGMMGAVLADTMWLLGFSLWRIRRRIMRKPDTDPPMMMRDFIRHSILFRRSGT